MRSAQLFNTRIAAFFPAIRIDDAATLSALVTARARSGGEEGGEPESRDEGFHGKAGCRRNFSPAIVDYSPVLLTEPSVGEVADTAPRERDEAELVRRAQLGSAAAFEQLVLARGPQLYRFLVVRLRDEADARDALQETLTAAWLGLPRLQETSRFWPWLCGIAAHKAVDAVRARGRVAEPAEVPAPERSGALEIREAIAELPEPLQQVLLLRYLLGLSEAEAARALGVRVGTVKSRSARARTAFMEVWR